MIRQSLQHFLYATERSPKPPQNGFTLIELLVVIAIISLLVSILLPSLQSAREIAKSVVCMSNLKNIGLGIVQYAEDFNGEMYVSYTDINIVNGLPNYPTSPKWWPQALGVHGYLPKPAGLYDMEYDKTTQDVWNCPTEVQLAAFTIHGHSSWTYLRILDELWYYAALGNNAALGTAGWAKIYEIESPGNQFFLIDGILAANEINKTYPYAGSGYSGATRFGMIASEFAGSGRAGFDHPGERANCLFSDWHVEAYARDEITQDMCDSPDP